LVRDEVFGRSETLNGVLDEFGQWVAVGFEQKTRAASGKRENTLVRPSTFRNSIPPRSHDAGDLCVQPGLERVSFGFSKKSGETILRITKLRETDADGEAQKLVGLQKGTDGKSFDMAGFGYFEDGSFDEGIFHGASPCLAWRSYYKKTGAR
jgi:hypothetical protein